MECLIGYTIARKLILSGSLFILLLCAVAGSYAQQINGATDFHISGKIEGKDTGTIVFWFTDFANTLKADTVRLDQGRFTFSGSVRAACEALLWTDLKNRNFDDPSVIRFILVPGKIQILKIAGSSQRAAITGSTPQIEKEKWDDVKAVYKNGEDSIDKNVASLRKAGADNPSVKSLLDTLYHRIDSLRAIRSRLDVGYIAKHPDTYLGGYLLSKRCRLIPLDSVMLFYKALADSVKNSSVGHEVLAYLYPLTNDSQFRSENPLIDKDFSRQLANIKSVYDLQLNGRDGKPVDLRGFSGKYLLLDVWASWCGPCIKNIPAWNKLQKNYDPAALQFVAVSLDRDAGAWKKSLSTHQPAGVQLADTASFLGLFSIYCKVLWVPRYLIVDPAGQIIEYDAPQPLEPELEQLLNKLVRKKNLLAE